MAHEDFEVMILTHLLIIVGELCEGQSRTTTYTHFQQALGVIPRLVVVADLRASVALVIGHLE